MIELHISQSLALALYAVFAVVLAWAVDGYAYWASGARRYE